MHILFLTHYFPPEVNAPASRTFEHARLWTSHGLSSAFLAFQAGVEQRAVFEHGAGDIEKTVADGAQSTGMAAAAGFQSKILGFALLIAPPGGVRQVVNGVPQSWIAGEPSGDGAAFARSPGDGGHAAQICVRWDNRLAAGFRTPPRAAWRGRSCQRLAGTEVSLRGSALAPVRFVRSRREWARQAGCTAYRAAGALL